MIDLLWTALSLLVPGAGALGLWGLALRLAAKFGLGWATAASTGPIFGLIAKLADFVLWIVKGVLGYAGRLIGRGLDVLASDVRAAVTAGLIAWAAFTLGGADLPWWRSVDPPAASSSRRSSPPKPVPKTRTCTDPFSECFWTGIF